MKKFIDKVTVTGADDSVAPSDLLKIADEYPFVEFGILLARRSMGHCRFPSLDWLQRLAAARSEHQSGTKINFAGHICGDWVNEIFLGNWPADLPGFMVFMMNRWQLNTHGITHKYDSEAMLQLIKTRNDNYNQEIIFQYDKMNPVPLKGALDQGLNVSALYDLSHGDGILPEQWERPTSGGRTFYCGYAGGLSPENLAQQMEKIASVAGGETAWIDAETHLRSPRHEHVDPRYVRGDVFDPNKVRGFLEAAKPWVL